MFRRFRRALAILIGFALIALFIWFAGPYFAFGRYRPLETAFSRLVAIALVVAWWLGWRLLKKLRALRASDLLAAAVVRQAQPAHEPPSPEVVQLRERFEEAVATLRARRGPSTWLSGGPAAWVGGRAGQNLYELPWYIIIGAPGSGKTTALVNSGLKFPLEQRIGRRALRGVGGTRNCDWWFTDEAVLLDTAGRYTTQDSDAASDAAGWREFLALLKKYRSRRPVNGVLVTISASDLMVESDVEREAYIEAARRRLNELHRELRSQLPVYVLVTKCDLVAGFTEYFDDLAQDGRSQVWGVTFPYDETASGNAAAAYPAEFDVLMRRLNERLLVRVEEDRDVRRRTAVFAFPQQMAALRNVLIEFVSEVFGATRLEHPVLLRGVYFTSGTQEGTPIDRLLGSLSRRFGVAGERVAPSTGRGKAYFIERLLKDVIVGESGLAGLNRGLEMRKAAAQVGAYATVALVAVLGVAALSVSAARNRAYVNDVSAALQKLREVPSPGGPATLGALLPRLDAVRAVVETADRRRESPPLGMRWGLYQGAAVGNAARDAYARELDSALLPRVAARIREGLIAAGSDPERVYEYLKAYLMLGDPRRLDKAYLREFARLEWQRADRQAPGSGASLARHFDSLLDQGESLRPMALDAELIARARATIRRASIPQVLYGRLQRRYEGDTSRGVRLDMAAGAGAEQVIRRASGVSLSQPLPSLYSRAVFREATTTMVAELIAEFSSDSWVWGDIGVFSNDPTRLAGDVINRYERDYIAAWDTVLKDLELVRFSTPRETAGALETLAGGGSPLRGVLAAVVDNTTLTDTPGVAEAPEGKLEAAGRAISEGLGKIVKPLVDSTGAARPGAFVTAHFQPIHRLMAGEPGSTPIDQLLAAVGQVQKQVQSLGPEVGSSATLEALSKPELREALQTLRQQSADAPPLVRALVSQVGSGTEGAVAADASTDLGNRYREEVLRPCLEVIPSRYPFTLASDTDVPLADFARLFGYDGVYDRFFKTHLTALVDTSHRPWAWRPGAVQLSHDMLDTFEAAQRIREMFFTPDAGMPLVNVSLTLGAADNRASRFVLEIDGTSYDYRRGPPRTVAARWPGPTPGSAAVTFDNRSKPGPELSFQGPWAWFRLIDSVGPQEGTETRFVLLFQEADRRARVEVDAASVRNPFANREWQRFSCGR